MMFHSESINYLYFCCRLTRINEQENNLLQRPFNFVCRLTRINEQENNLLPFNFVFQNTYFLDF